MRALPAQTLAPGSSAVALNLADYFTVPGVVGDLVVFDTVFGRFAVELHRSHAPRHVTNFLGYVGRGAYDSSFIHRSAALDATGAIAIVQGGGYTAAAVGVSEIPADAPVPLEYNLPNDRGTLAMARGSDPNSATSQWYINVRENASILGPANGGGYTVFGRVLGTGMTVVDHIAAQPRVNAGVPFDELPVRNYSSGNVELQHFILINSIRQVSLLPGAGGESVVTFAVQSSNAGVVNATLNGSTLSLQPGAAGSATVTVTATDVNGNTVNGVFTVNVAQSGPPTVVESPAGHTIARGDSVALSARINNATSYQWQRDGADIPGAVSALLVIRNVSAAQAGSYRLVARNAAGNVVTDAATLTVQDTAPVNTGRLINLSIRSNAGTGDQSLAVGFSLGGAGTSGAPPLLLRAIGPSLSPFGVSGLLPDPVATLYSGQTALVSNDNWNGDGQVEALRARVGAFGFSSTTSLDAALATAPAPGVYTMQVSGKGGQGVALAEIYDATEDSAFTAGTPRLINVSARSYSGTNENVLTAGFVVRGSTSRTVLIRAAGPALEPFGVNGRLANPRLQLYRQGENTPLATNEDWGGDAQVSAVADSVGAFPFTNTGSADAALVITLPPGNYSAQVSGSDGGTGVALVELYEVR